jgi:uncharacterized repeat protein (TIGR03803 family)
MRRWCIFVAACLSGTLLAACNGAYTGGEPLPGPPARGLNARSQAWANNVPLAQENVLYPFQGGTDGAHPLAGLLAGKNSGFYGTTFNGGAGPSGGVGTVFKVSSSGAETVLYSFQGASDGSSPEAGLIAGKKGVLYGDTVYGGSTCATIGCGTVFELVPKGAGYLEHVLYAFAYGNDGGNPIGGLLIDKSGGLYGTTSRGGGSTACTNGCGTVFKLTPSGSGFAETVLYHFQGGSDGATPDGTLIADGKGSLYGTTYGGGSGTACSGGCGTVFRLALAGSVYTESILYNFQGRPNDGANPRAALLAGKNGALFGVTLRGGAKNAGTVFQLTPSRSGYSERVLYAFKGGKDGALPHDENGLHTDTIGALYGTTLEGGSGTGGGNGIVFKLTPSGSGYSETVLHRFLGGSDGVNSYGSLAADATGLLYGATFSGGVGSCSGSVPGCGIVFKVSP